MSNGTNTGMWVRGTLYFNPDDANGNPTGLTKIVGIASLEIKTSTDIKEQISKDKDSFGEVTASVAIPKPVELGLTIQNFSKESLVLGLLGTSALVSSGGGTVTDEPVTAKLGIFVALTKGNLTAGSVVVTKSVKGTGTGYTSTNAGFAIGTTSIPVITGSGTILAGDKVTFAGDTNEYEIATGVAAPGTIALASPGLIAAIPAAATALTIVDQDYVEGTDYEINYAIGWLSAITGGAITANQSLKVDFAHGAIAGYKVSGSKVASFKGQLYLDGANLSDGTALKINVPRALLTSDSAIDFMGDKAVEFKMKGRAELKSGETAAYYVESLSLS
ncbi:hypothetical protein UFOVP1367_13 [uncultured Caudovirales phage]|uniref:Major tail protein n=1 Tax=uncultured Caudovirales phage TaxID=2100421 RepID=A0A6J5RVA4_9CAUD|nr:major tail protein with Ig-like domain [uncultured Caudovirales phage]CAB4202403.1 hypothetical protein UFOVP1367_13 [uncultured Caudovirales phage]